MALPERHVTDAVAHLQMNAADRLKALSSEMLAALAEQLAAKLAVAVKIGKEVFYQQLEMPLDKAYAYTGQVIVENMVFRETEAGISDFIETRDPDWDQ